MTQTPRESIATNELEDQPSRPGTIHRLLRQPVTVICLVFLAALVLAAIFAPLITPYDPSTLDVLSRLQGASGKHLLGTDDLGRDTLTRSVFAGRVALQATVQSVGLALIVGVPLGIAAGFIGGWTDRILMRVVDVIQAMPLLLIAFAVVAVLGQGLTNAMVAVSVVFAAGYMRLARAVTLSLRPQLYIEAARVLGFGTVRIIMRHLLPNARGPIIVQSSIYLGTALLIEAMLSFLGLGAPVGAPSWGSMLQQSMPYQARQPLLSIVPGLLITLTVLAFNLVGDGLRDALGGEVQRPRRRRATPVAVTRTAPGTSEVRGETMSELPGSPRTVLAVSGLAVQASLPGGEVVSLLDDVSFHVNAGQMFGVVGESGSGKSMLAMSVMKLLPANAWISSGSIVLGDRDVVPMGEPQLRHERGRSVGYIFQNPMAALSPVHTIGKQICDSITAHEHVSRSAARARAIGLLDRVGVANAAERLDDYPHQFSGGMAQRVVIAAALASRPRLLIADEPTTALDVTVQSQVLDLLAELARDLDMGVLLITHDLAVISETCSAVAVMYAGHLVERGRTIDLFTHPRHPYTSALLQANPSGVPASMHLPTIAGSVPPAWAWPTGCRFHPRCPYAIDLCRERSPELVADVRCHRAKELALPGVEDPGWSDERASR